MLLNIALNVLIFGAPVILIGLYYRRKNKKIQETKMKYRIQGLREDWIYADVWLEIVDKHLNTISTNGCAIYTFLFLNEFYSSELDILNIFSEEIESKEGVSNTKVNKFLKAHYVVTSLNHRIAKKAKSTSKEKSKKTANVTVETLLHEANEMQEVILCFQPNHVGIIMWASGNKFIDVLQSKETIFDKDLHRLVLVSIKEELEEDEEENK